MDYVVTRLTYQAPRRCWTQGETGWYSHAWTQEDVDDARTAGAWFNPGSHDFVPGVTV